MSNGISATPLEIFTNYGVINGEIMHMFFLNIPPKSHMYNSSPIKTAMEPPNFKGTLRVSSQALTTRSLQPVSRRGYYGKFIKHQTQWAFFLA